MAARCQARFEETSEEAAPADEVAWTVTKPNTAIAVSLARSECTLTRIRRQFVVYFCLHRGKCAEKHGKLARVVSVRGDI